MCAYEKYNRICSSAQISNVCVHKLHKDSIFIIDQACNFKLSATLLPNYQNDQNLALKTTIIKFLRSPSCIISLKISALPKISTLNNQNINKYQTNKATNMYTT